jgi:hypothetical protein
LEDLWDLAICLITFLLSLAFLPQMNLFFQKTNS